MVVVSRGQGQGRCSQGQHDRTVPGPELVDIARRTRATATGLLRVVRSRTPRNSKGGLYEQFELKRLEDGQPSLESYKNARPTCQERSDFDMIKFGYRSAPRVFAAEDEVEMSG